MTKASPKANTRMMWTKPNSFLNTPLVSSKILQGMGRSQLMLPQSLNLLQNATFLVYMLCLRSIKTPLFLVQSWHTIPLPLTTCPNGLHPFFDLSALPLRLLSYQRDRWLTSSNISNALELISFPLMELALETLSNSLSKGSIGQKICKDNKVNASTIIKMVKHSLSTTQLYFRGRILSQTKGVAMGNPLAPIIAEIMMQKIQTQAFAPLPRHQQPLLL